MRNILYAALLLIYIPSYSLASTNNQKLVGQGSLHYFLWHIYDAKLYSSNGEFSFTNPFSLRLEYKRKLYGAEIADRSTEEIRKLGFNDEVKLAAWHAQMKEIFPDVDKGVSLTGFYKPNSPTVFYKNDTKIGTIKDSDFGKWFFGIWLNENTSEPTLRKSLLGGA